MLQFPYDVRKSLTEKDTYAPPKSEKVDRLFLVRVRMFQLEYEIEQKKLEEFRNYGLAPLTYKAD